MLLGLACVSGTAWSDQVTVGVKAGYFVPGAQSFRDSYKAGFAYGADLSVRLVGGLSFWAGADLFSKAGTTSYTHEAVKIRVIPIYGGLKLRLGREGSGARPYLAGAAGYFRTEETGEIGKVTSGRAGFLGQLGVEVRLVRSLYLDFQARYSRCRALPASDPEDSQVGGFFAGLGLAAGF
jgi:hypothetical protein